MSRAVSCGSWSYRQMYLRVDFRILLFFIFLTFDSYVDATDNDGTVILTEVACDNANLTISCNDTGVISILKATYGRIDKNTCDDRNHQTYKNWSIPCHSSANATGIVSKKCQNRTSCVIADADPTRFYQRFGDRCPVTAKYLTVNYTCNVTADISTTLSTISTKSDPASSTDVTSKVESKSSTDGFISTTLSAISTKSDPAPAGTTDMISKVESPSSTGEKKIKLTSTEESASYVPSKQIGDESSVEYDMSGDGIISTTLPTKSIIPNQVGTTVKSATVEATDSKETSVPSAYSTVQPITEVTTTEPCICLNETRGNMAWKSTDCNKTANTTCPNNRNRQKALLTCSDREWNNLNLIGCITEEIERMKEELNELPKNFSVAAMNELMTNVKNISQSNDLNGGDLYELTDVIVQLIELSQEYRRNLSVSDAENLSELALNSASYLLSDNYTETWMELLPPNRSQTATRLLVTLESSSAILARVSDRPIRINKSVAGIGELQIIVHNSKQAAVVTPSVVLSTNESLFEINLKEIEKRSNDGLGRTVFIQYDNIEKWLTPSDDGGIDQGNNVTQIITKVVSASIISSEKQPAKLKEPVKFTLQHKLKPLNWNNTGTQCVYWDFKANDYIGNWSTEGCKVLSSDENSTTCECNHLTNFAILMSTKPIPPEHAFALHVITYVGVAISIVFLILALCTFCLFRNLQSDRNTIHKNLVLCLLISELIFIFGIGPGSNELFCSVIAGFLHYFFLASFAWMCLEGAQLYILLIEVFETEKSRVKWYYLGGYGIPALIVLISVSVNISMKVADRFRDADKYFNGTYGAYGTKTYCWLSLEQNFIWSFVGPVIAIIALNSVMLGVAIHMMCKHASSTASWKLKEKSKIHTIGSWVRGAAILVVLLGPTWIFGVLYVVKETIAFAYVFAIFNSLQGFFIFVFHCAANEKVQKEYRRAIQRSEWLPYCVRMKYGGLNDSGALSTPFPSSSSSSSSGKTLFQRMFPKNKRKQSVSSCSPLKSESDSKSTESNYTDSKSTENRVLVIFDSSEDYPQRATLKRPQLSSSSESARLTDSSGIGSSRDESDHVDESGFNASDRCEDRSIGCSTVRQPSVSQK